MIETFLSSSLLSAAGTAIIRLWQQSQQDKHEQRLLEIQRDVQDAKDRQLARETKDDGWSKKYIASLAATVWAFTIVYPGIMESLGLDSTVNYVYYEWRSGFLFFTEGKESLKSIVVHGMRWTDLDSAILGNIVGYLFGGSVARRR